MWCSLEEKRRLSRSIIASVNDYLQLSRNEPPEPGGGEWPDTWESDSETDSTDTTEPTLNFHECLVSCSPNLDFVIIGRRQRAIIVSFEPSAGSEGSIAGRIECGENLSTLLVLPAGDGAGKGRPYQWTVILVGTDKGDVRFYSADRRGTFLFDTRFVPDAAVVSIDLHPCSTGQSLSILHSNGVLVSVDGLCLFATLKAVLDSNTPQARATEFLQELNQSKRYTLGKVPPLSSSSRSDRLSAFHRGIHVQSDRLSQMLSASMIGGSGASLSEEPPFGLLHSTLGDSSQRPFMSFYWLPEHKTELSFGALVSNVSTRVKSMVTGGSLGSFGAAGASFLGSFIGPQGREGAPPPKSVNLDTRFTIFDAHRSGLGSYPVYSLHGVQALVDTRARICLVDSENGQVLRVWKGFRDGQCGFLTSTGSVPPEESGGAKRSARTIFAVLYAPRNGVLEVYPALFGPRYGAFNVGRTGKLVQLSSPVLGQERPVLSGVVFLDKDGCIKSVSVPFSMALQDESGQSLRDAALVKELRKTLVNFDNIQNASLVVERLLNDLKTYDYLKNSLRIIRKQTCLSASDMDTLLGLCAEASRKLAQPEKLSDRPAHEFELLASMAENDRNMINLFVAISVVRKAASNPGTNELQVEELHDLLDLEEEKLSTFITALNGCLIARAQVSREKKSEEVLLTEFLASFQLEKDRHGDRVKLNPELRDAELVRLGNFIFSGIFTSHNFEQSYAKIVPALPLPYDSVISLMLKSWLSKPHTYSALPANVFRFLAKLIPPVPEQISTLDSLTMTGLLSSKYLPESLALAIVVRGVLRALDGKSNRESTDESFELVDSRQEKWDNLVLTCYTLLPILSLSYHLATPDKPIPEYKLVSLPRLLECRHDSVVPLVSNAISEGNNIVKPGKLIELFGKVESDLNELNLPSWEVCFVKTIRTFPLSLTPDRLFSLLAIEYGTQWADDLERLELVQCSVEYAKAIANPVVQHGIANFLWMSQLSPRFQKLIHLMEKIGKFPKDRLARKDVGVGEEKLVDFADASVDVLNVLFDANSQFEASSLSVVEGLEDHLVIFFEKFSTPDPSNEMPLSRLAFTTRCTNYHLVKLYWQLALVVRLMLQGRLRPGRPYDVFDAKGKAALTKTLHSYPLLPRNEPTELDMRTQVARSQFFRSYVTSVLSNHLPYPPRFDNSIALPELNRACALLGEWDMPSDMLWVHCVLELYSMGYDHLAEQKMCMVQNKANLGAELLMLVGQRLAVKLSDPLDKLGSSSAVSLLSPTLKTWLKTQDLERIQYKESTISAMKTALRYARTHLPENNAESLVAKQLTEFLEKFA